MTSPNVPRVPEGPPAEAEAKGSGGDLESFQAVAETVGMMPSLRVRDNLVQGLVVLVGGVIGMVAGWLVLPDVVGLVLGGLAGVVAFGLLSGLVLMVLGWVRLARRRR